MAECNRETKILVAILLSGLAVRLVFSPFFADYNDFAYWTGTAFDVVEGNGIYRGYDFWYPPVWGYIISLMTPLMDLFGITPVDTVVDSASSIGYWSGDGFITNSPAVFIIKLPLILSDIACGYLVSDERKSLIACALWIFCPLTIYTSAVQGQFETIETLFILLALWSYLKGSYLESGAFIAASVLTKPFSALIVIPLAALILTKCNEPKERLKSFGKYAAGGLLMTLFLVLPQLVYGESQYLLGFLADRSSIGYPLPNDFIMSMMPVDAASQSLGDRLTPSGSNVSAFFYLSFLLSLILSVFIIARKGMNDRNTVLVFAAAVSLHLMWYPATGYSQYYVPIIAMLSICASIDKRYLYAGIAVTVFAMCTALWGFRHAYQLYLLGFVDIDTINNAYSVMRSVFDIPDTISTHLKFLPVLATVVISMILMRRPSDEA